MLDALLHEDRTRRWGEHEADTQHALAAQALHVAALLGQGGAPALVVLSCRQARWYVPGLLGAWLAGATVELLPNVQAATLDRVDADPDVAHVLHDDQARQARSAKAICLPIALAAAVGAPPPAPAPRGPALAVRMTTSGTTERPRYVGKTLAQLLGEVAVLARVVPPPARVLSTVPFSHLYGLLFGVLLPLRQGARIISHEALLPADLAAVLGREQVDLMVSTPAHLRAMATAVMPRGLRVISSGAPLPGELHLALGSAHGWQVTDILGSTETGGIATRAHPAAPWTPLPGVAVSAPDGQLSVASPWCDGGRAALDDRIELAADGTFRHLGRASELLKIAGKRAHARALEATALAVPGVTDAAVLAYAAAGREARVALAYCVAAGGPTVSREQLAAAIRAQFDAVFVPRVIKQLPAIPRSERGKVTADALRAALGLDDEPATHHIPLAALGGGEYRADIPANLVFFRGHFDELAILPGAVLVERVIWPAVRAEFPEVRGLRGIRRLRFRRPVLPGQELRVRLTRDARRLTFDVSCAAAPVASGQLVVE